MIKPAPLPSASPVTPSGPLNPGDASTPDDGLFGLRHSLEEALVVALPVPYEATCSSRHGTLDGPRALLDASCQVDLHDFVLGEPWRRGLAAVPESEEIRELSERAKGAAERVRDGDASARSTVENAGREVWAWLEDAVDRVMASGRIPLVLGGEHGISSAAFRAAARREPGLGILQIDAHADLRVAYEGFVTSHASVMHRAIEIDDVARLVQVGLRDVSREESDVIDRAGSRIVAFSDQAVAAAVLGGRSFADIALDIVSALPERVWISFDIDGLDPALCPGTGTPVPGGLSWREANLLIDRLVASGRRLVGADLVEIGPTFWDGFVAAKLAYRICAALVAARQEHRPGA